MSFIGVSWWISTAVTAALLLRIVAGGLARPYPFFVLLLIAAQLRSAALHILAGSPSSTLYGRLWFSSEPVLIALRCAAIFEAYRHLAARYTRMGWLGLAIPVAGAAAGGGLVWASWGAPVLSPAYSAIVGLARGCWATLAAAFAISWWLLDRVPSPAARPATRHAWLFLGYASSQALPFAAVHTIGEAAVPGMSAAALILATGLQAAWCVLIERPAAAPAAARAAGAELPELRARAAELLGALVRR